MLRLIKTYCLEHNSKQHNDCVATYVDINSEAK